jgi:hypothetical protein
MLAPMWTRIREAIRTGTAYIWRRRIAILGVVLGVYSAIGAPGVGRTETVKAPACQVCKAPSTTPPNGASSGTQETKKTHPPSSSVVIAGLALAALLILLGSADTLRAFVVSTPPADGKSTRP